MSVVAAAVFGGALVGGVVASKGASKAANAQENAANTAAATELEMFNKNVELQKPWRDAGMGALSQLTAGTAAGGDFNRDFTMKDFNADPGYAFRTSEGLKGIEASAAARGGALSGGALKDLSDYGQASASGEYSNAYNRFNADRDRRFNRLSGIAGTGQTATNQITNQGAEVAQNVGNYQTQAGNARASGYVGQANAINGAVGTIGNWWQQSQQPSYTSPNFMGSYANPAGSTYDYRSAVLPDSLRGGGG